ncbi:metalloregulator ArsR/SmtB family transcription factor [Paraconexibacter antarcticus]|uniref:Metalloregulator ArsR/SmtB family transcription factor n=1 Tax=Paraconexibacter antarcticus TaxID=2949664 RepID=A0ABY5DTU1_9ACTN|nr:metalloregulator ArsR/SmtB family transcription factor [Paraconexibacter antarcticus]UTI63969.1 metalloregulator ArsR/SmtB family transcription factor [Paraconexibacter antarcticus]
MDEHGELLHIDQPAATRIRQAGLATADAERVAGVLKGLADPTRLNLALALRDGQELCVCDLSWIARRSQNLVSHHMKVLRTEGLVTARKDGKMTMFKLTPTGHALVTIAGHLADRSHS